MVAHRLNRGGRQLGRSPSGQAQARGVNKTITLIHVAGHDVSHIRPIGRSRRPFLSRQSGLTRNTPLIGHPSRRVGSACRGHQPRLEGSEGNRQNRTRSPPSPVSIYVFNEFAVRTKTLTSLRFQSLVRDDSRGGVVHADLDLFGSTLTGVALSPASIRMMHQPNAGGNSVLSEVMSCELLHRCYGAHLLKTEMEVEYWPEGGSLTDYTCRLFDTTLGVSVTRAMRFGGRFTTEDAERLLMKKLRGVVQSSRNSLERWTKQVLHVWATSRHTARELLAAYDKVADDIKSNTVVFITTARNAREIFANR